MSEWKKTRLGEIADCTLGKMLDANKNKGKPRQYLANVDVRWGRFDLTRLQTMKMEDGELAKYSLRPDDLVMCEGGEPGRCAIWQDGSREMYIQKALMRIRAHKELNIWYLYFWFCWYAKRGGLTQYQTGTGIKHMPLQKLVSVELPLPPRHIQDRIAGILSDYDSAIANCRKQIALLEEAAMRLYREWFKDGKGEKKRIGDFVKIKRGKVITKATATIGSIPVIAAGLEPAYFTDKHNVDAPCITISASGANAGHVALHHENIWASDCSYVSRKETPYIFFIYELLKDKAIAIRQLQKGSAQPHVHASDVERIEMVMPSEQQLKEYEQKVAALFGGIRNLHNQIRTLTEARDRLLPKLMKGEIAV